MKMYNSKATHSLHFLSFHHFLSMFALSLYSFCVWVWMIDGSSEDSQVVSHVCVDLIEKMLSYLVWVNMWNVGLGLRGIDFGSIPLRMATLALTIQCSFAFWSLKWWELCAERCRGHVHPQVDSSLVLHWEYSCSFARSCLGRPKWCRKAR